MIKILQGDCLEVMRGMAADSVDSVVTDPPYGLSFMGKHWDYDVPVAEVWAECLRVLKPGGHLLAFAGTRTQHRMAVRIEDAGFEIRDMIAWVYGSGFPKSLDVSKALDKAAGAEREVVGLSKGRGGGGLNNLVRDGGNDASDAKGCGAYGVGAKQITIDIPITAPATEAARQWQGWGTALKPAMEPITVARKPLVGTVAANVLAHGTGGLNIDGCRVGVGDDRVGGGLAKERFGINGMPQTSRPVGGRWPANLIHDGSDEVLECFPSPHPAHTQIRKPTDDKDGQIWNLKRSGGTKQSFGDSGSAARFFYCAKVSKKDRDEGCEGMDEKKMGFSNGAQLHGEGYDKGQDIGLNRVISRRNHHPTVKPTDLMRYLCRLVTPPGGIVLDPFAGSGSTGKACAVEGFRFIGIEREAEYCEIARARIAAEGRAVQYLQPKGQARPTGRSEYMSKQSSERKASKSAQVVGRSLDRVVGRDELVEELAGLIWEVQTRTCCKPHHFADIEEKNKRFWKKADALGYDRASLVESARTILSEPIPTPNPKLTLDAPSASVRSEEAP